MKTVFVNDTSYELSEKSLTSTLKKVCQILKKKKVTELDLAEKEITLVFLDKLAAKKLNWQYRQKDYPTDILSFEGAAPESLGELVFCPEVLTKQAEEHGQSFQRELDLMMIHGVLHLLGFDHETSPEDDQKMTALQNEIWQEVSESSSPAKRKKTTVKISSQEKRTKAVKGKKR